MDRVLHKDITNLISAYSNIADLLQDYNLLTDAIYNYKKALELCSNISDNSDIFPHRIESLHVVTSFYQNKLEKYITLNHHENYIKALWGKGLAQVELHSHPHIRHSSVLICISAFNRKKVTGLSLAQIKRYKHESCEVHVYNDHSTEYDNAFLEPYADKVVQLPRKMGPHNLRWHYFSTFLESHHSFLYMTDNDIVHDPDFIGVLQALYEIGGKRLPVCIYNSSDHWSDKTVFYCNNGIILKKTAPGFSMFFDRSMVKKIVSVLNDIGHCHDNYGADYRAIAYLGLPWITSATSYAEHYGAGGINNLDYETDRAINPTRYLQERRQDILQYLTEDIQLNIDF